MPNKMLIDATHPEETRVVVVRGNRVEEFDFESAQRKQLRGNIYLAKVTRVEPSLQAAFIEYGGNRHGFLAFSEIHPDYYQIPVADRQALIEADERAHREAEEESENRSSRRRSRHRNSRRRGHGDRVRSAVVEDANQEAQPHHPHDGDDHSHDDHAHGEYSHTHAHDADHHHADPDHHHDGDHEHTHAHTHGADVHEHDAHEHAEHEDAQDHGVTESVSFSSPTEAAVAEVIAIPEVAEPETVSDPEHVAEAQDEHVSDSNAAYADDTADADQADSDSSHGDNSLASTDDDHHAEGEDDEGEDTEEEEQVESVGGDDALEEVPERAYRPRRQYKIQEVIKRRQVMLVQVVKEERGNKGAALTTYLSLAGRYAVLMPNTARGGGISRKITSAQDRSRLKEVVQDLDVPEGMGIILRTAGASRTKPEIKRDFEYLIRMWETVRDMTLRSQAPTLVYEEGSLIKRSLRDLYNKEIDEVMVAGEAGYQEARDFMKMLMPSNVRAVKQYRDGQPLFSRMGVESQLDAMFSPTVQLRSGGYLVINQTEALVSIDVNSGRSTREHHIEDTALKTNLEAAEEVARQLRLRDLAGLIVIDFIDMDEKRNNRAVERKLSDCLRHDRARIQVGRISHFGLLEMSRQRIRASVLESSTEPCPHCGGTGHVRSVSSVALQLLRGLEEILMKGATHNLVVRTRTEVALYVLNHKRGHLRDLENGFKVTLAVIADPTVNGQQSYIIDRGEQVHTLEAAKALLAAQLAASPPQLEESYDDEEPFEFEAEETDETEGLAGEQAAGEGGDTDGEGRKRKRRRRRRGRSGEARDGLAARDDDGSDASQSGEATDTAGTADDTEAADETGDQDAESRADGSPDGERRPRRRGRRGGRRRRGNGSEGGLADSIADELGPASEPEVTEAVADFDSAPPLSEQQTRVDGNEPQPRAEPSQPLQAEAAISPVQADEAPAESEKIARRRSTVREKVSFASQPDPVPAVQASPEPPAAAEPAQPAEEAAEASQPRRAGWWSRRFGNGS
jgi:ribonuclease E